MGMARFPHVSNMHRLILPPEVSLASSGQSSAWPDVQKSWQAHEFECAGVAATGVEDGKQGRDSWRPSGVQLLQGYQCSIINCSELFVFTKLLRRVAIHVLLFAGGFYLYYADHRLQEAICSNQEGGGLVLRGWDEEWLGMAHVATLSISTVGGQLLQWMFPYLFQVQFSVIAKFNNQLHWGQRLLVQIPVALPCRRPMSCHGKSI